MSLFCKVNYKGFNWLLKLLEFWASVNRLALRKQQKILRCV